MHLTVLELKYSNFPLWTILATLHFCLFIHFLVKIVSFEDSQCLSALYQILLAACSSAQISQYQGEYLCWWTIAKDNGAWLSSIERRQQWNCSAEWLPTKWSSSLISRENSCLSMELMLRLNLYTVVCSGMVKYRLQIIARWWDVSLLVTGLGNRMLSSGWYKIQSSIWPCLWVGTWTECSKL